MRNIILTLLALTTTLSYAHATLAPTATAIAQLSARDNDDDEISSRLSRLISSATHALDDSPSEATSILSELREQYSSIAGDATGCGSSWARITNAVGEFDDGFFDGIANLADEVFGGDDDDDEGDECEISDENGASRGAVAYAVVGMGLLGVAAVL